VCAWQVLSESGVSRLPQLKDPRVRCPLHAYSIFPSNRSMSLHECYSSFHQCFRRSFTHHVMRASIHSQLLSRKVRHSCSMQPEADQHNPYRWMMTGGWDASPAPKHTTATENVVLRRARKWQQHEWPVSPAPPAPDAGPAQHCTRQSHLGWTPRVGPGWRWAAGRRSPVNQVKQGAAGMYARNRHRHLRNEAPFRLAGTHTPPRLRWTHRAS
jgi:hypothetical protein